ncbi:TRAP transporter large permease [Pseudohoeflea coraliihabitans]|uniref:TRAP transporter large permease protein n=1 Tax=Pseudohoeflea coraliihabitans TaxID=2860393 RepID=A0ABS6WJZ5_9HYPH|nr:TRAP transporter large permease [Pseudohoeflea sp. DP4N28-3]MBW3096263.1 TRAP transporter large permease [Pseudohoeflea sp. DP4N28-3]
MSIEVIVDILLLMGLLIIGVPVPFCFAAAALFLFLTGDYVGSNFLVAAGFNKTSSIILLAMPLFILVGEIMSTGSLAARLVDFCDSIFGRLKGGLGVVVIVVTAVFGAISGTASSAVAAMGTIMVPRLVERGYDRGYAAALVAASSVLALLIPPSSAQIVYGWISGTSIAACFLAPIVPALLLMGLFSAWNFVMTRNMPIVQPEAVGARQAIKDIGVKGRRATLGLVMPFIILTSIYGGLATPTEAAAIAVVYALIVGVIIFRDIPLRELWRIGYSAGTTVGVVMVLVFFAVMLSRLYTMENVPQSVVNLLLSISENRIVLLLLINVFLIVLGMIMDDFSGLLLATPMLLPVIRELDIHPVHFAAIIGVNLGMGNITPPTAPLLYFGARIGKTRLQGMLKPTLILVLFAYLPVLLLTTFIPDLSLWLPRLVLGIN